VVGLEESKVIVSPDTPDSTAEVWYVIGNRPHRGYCETQVRAEQFVNEFNRSNGENDFKFELGWEATTKIAAGHTIRDRYSQV
jgi:hypothetical protein